eukprot:1000-Heterococcus_DN1.PRE.11
MPHTAPLYTDAYCGTVNILQYRTHHVTITLAVIDVYDYEVPPEMNAAAASCHSHEPYHLTNCKASHNECTMKQEACAGCDLAERKESELRWCLK